MGPDGGAQLEMRTMSFTIPLPGSMHHRHGSSEGRHEIKDPFMTLFEGSRECSGLPQWMET